MPEAVVADDALDAVPPEPPADSVLDELEGDADDADVVAAGEAAGVLRETTLTDQDCTGD